MSLTRFRSLLRMLQFDDKNARAHRRELDKLSLIREFFDIFLDNCKTDYSFSEFVTEDENLEAFRDRCGFRQHIRPEPDKYGIKSEI